MFYGEDLFEDQEAWFVETVRAACENDRVNWVVKLHPANAWKRRRDGVEYQELDEVAAIRERIGELPPHVALLLPDSDIHPRSIFDVADWGVTIRGSVGLELPCLGVPALTAGTGFYAGRGFTVDSETTDEYRARLLRIEETPPPTGRQIELARRYLHALFHFRPTTFESFRIVHRSLDGGHPLAHDVELLADGRRLATEPGMRAFAHWAVHSRATDFLTLEG